MKQLKLSWLWLLSALIISGGLFVGCQKDASSPDVTSNAKPAPKLNALTLSCVNGKATGSSITISVTAGASGAPAGFSVQWMLKSEYDANGGWPTSSDVIPTSSFCKASFSGVPGASQYNLQPGIPVEVEIGDVIFDQVGASSTCAETPLECGEAYVFRAFAHNVPGGAAKSDWSSTITCNTASCGGGDGGCTYTQGYWKTHGPIPTGQNEYVWPDEVKLNGLMLGNVTYSADDLLTILKTPAAGNGLLSMAHQLIAAKLNVANGAEPTDIASTIANADLLIGDLDILNGGFLSPAVTSSLNDMLADFNEGRPDVGPGHCD